MLFNPSVSANSIVHAFAAGIHVQSGRSAGHLPGMGHYHRLHRHAPLSIVVNAGIEYAALTPGTSAGSTGPTCGVGGSCFDGPGSTGVQWRAIDIAANQTYLGGLAVQTNLTFSTGGVAGAPIGVAFPLNAVANIGSAVSHAAGAAAFEADVSLNGTVDGGVGVQVVAQGSKQPAYRYSALVINGALTAPFFGGIVIGPTIDPNGRGIVFGGSATEIGGTLGTVPYRMASAIDMNDVLPSAVCNVTGTTYAYGTLGCPASLGQGHRYWMTRAGTGEIGDGTLYLQTGTLSGSASGLTIDTLAFKMTAATLAANSDGTNWTSGNLAEDTCGDQGAVTASGGAVSLVTITLAGYGEVGASGECPASGGNIIWHPKSSGPVGPTGQTEPPTPFTVPVANYVWTQGTTLDIGNTIATTIALGNSGSTTTIAGTIKAGSSTGLSCTGTPSSSFATVNGIVTHC